MQLLQENMSAVPACRQACLTAGVRGGRYLLSYTECGENNAQDVIRGDLACDGTQVILSQSDFTGGKYQVAQLKHAAGAFNGLIALIELTQVTTAG